MLFVMLLPAFIFTSYTGLKTTVRYLFTSTTFTETEEDFNTICEWMSIFGYSAFGSPFIFAALGVIPNLLMYSSKELSDKQIILRKLYDYVYEKTETVWLPSLMHGATNAFTIFGYLSKPEYADRAILGPLYIGIISMIPMIILAVIICVKQKRN